MRGGAHRRRGGLRAVQRGGCRGRCQGGAVLALRPLRRRRGRAGRRDLDAIAAHLDVHLLGLEAADLDARPRVGVYGDGESAGLLEVGAGAAGVDGDGSGGDGRGEDGGVAGLVREAGNGGVPERDGVGGGGGGEGEVVVDVHELLVGVLGGDGELDGVGEDGRGGGGGEVERGEADGGDGEAGALRAVEQVEDAARGGGDYREEDDDQQRPAEAAAEAATAGPAASALGRALRPVDGALVHLRLGRRRAFATVGHCGRRGGLGGGVDAVGHCSRRRREDAVAMGE